MASFHTDNLGGVALYNPHLLSKDELRADFVARNAELNRLTDDLRSRIGQTPQHHLVLGQRGMGKSTLLRRLAYAVEDDAALAAAYVPLVLPEEQYNVKHLTDLWLNCLDAISDALEAQGEAGQAAAIDMLVATLPTDASPEAELATRTALLAQASLTGRRLLLLLDNLDLVLDRIRDQDWKLREILQESDAFVLVGASASALEVTWDYGRAFYDFFRVHRLSGLTDEETQQVLVALAVRRNNERVRDIALHHPERVRPVRLFAGGNPRTIAVLYEVLAAGPDNDLRAVLETLLDRYTPLYKARFEALAVQAQQVVDELCQHWDPATAADLAAGSGLEVNKVSAQLDRMVVDGLVEKVQAVDKKTGRKRKKNAFQISERFFNIWYLMRASRRARRRLGWLVRFLEAFEGSDGVALWGAALAKRAWGADGAKDAQFAVALLDVVDGTTRWMLERKLAAVIAERPELVADLGLAEGEYATQISVAMRMRKLLEALPQFKTALLRNESVVGDLTLDVNAAETFLLAPGLPTSMKEEVFADALADPPSLGSSTVSVLVVWSTFQFHECARRDLPWLGDLARSSEQGAYESGAEVIAQLRAVPGMSEAGAVFANLALDAVNLGVALTLELATAAFLPKCDSLSLLRDATDGLVSDVLLASNAPSGAWTAISWSLLATGHRERALAYLQRLHDASDESFTRWLPIMELQTRGAVALGLAAQARDLIDEANLTDRWRPMREALHARALHSPDVLDALAPEVREPSRRLYDSWLNIPDDDSDSHSSS